MARGLEVRRNFCHAYELENRCVVAHFHLSHGITLLPSIRTDYNNLPVQKHGQLLFLQLFFQIAH